MYISLSFKRFGGIRLDDAERNLLDCCISLHMCDTSLCSSSLDFVHSSGFTATGLGGFAGLEEN